MAVQVKGQNIKQSNNRAFLPKTELYQQQKKTVLVLWFSHCISISSKNFHL